MRAGVGEQSDLAVGVAERDELLAEHEHADGIAIGGRQLFAEHGGQPVLAEEVAHRGAESDPGDELVFFLTEHLCSGLLR